MAIKGLTEGRIVHYVLEDGNFPGEHRPAIVVKVWDRENGTCNLRVFTDGPNDFPDNLDGILHCASVLHDDDHEPGTWHFIEYQD